MIATSATRPRRLAKTITVNLSLPRDLLSAAPHVFCGCAQKKVPVRRQGVAQPELVGGMAKPRPVEAVWHEAQRETPRLHVG